MGYQRPVDAPISDSWNGHRNRTPPSSEPGTDYACAYGTRIAAAAAGVVVDWKTSNGSATGRYITVDLDDGRRVRYLHLAEAWYAPGTRVGRGQFIALSGASANGSDWGVGAHVHTTLWAGHYYQFGASATLDFEAYVGDEPTPEPEPEPEQEEGQLMHAVIYTKDTDDDSRQGAIIDVETGFISKFSWFPASYADSIARGFGHDQATPLTNGQFNGVIKDFEAFQASRTPSSTATTTTRADNRQAATLTGPAWVIGALLGLIGLVEVVRLVVDLVV